MANYKEGGLVRKYEVIKIDGSESDPDADYFVLRLDKDPHSLVAIGAYAESVEIDNPELSRDLIKRIRYYHGNRSMKVFVDGNSWCATYENFIDIHDSPAGFGDTPEEAIASLRKEGYDE